MTRAFHVSLVSALLLAILVAPGCGSGGGQSVGGLTPRFTEYPVPVGSNDPSTPPPGSWPDDLKVDAAGNIWFAEHHADQIGKFSTSGIYQGFPVPTPNGVMDGITVDDARQTVWATETAANNIVRLDLNTGHITEIPTPTAGATPGDIVVQSDGTVWFSEGYEGGTGVGRIATLKPATNTITEIRIPSTPNGMDGIIVTSANVVWFAELNDNKIGSYTGGTIREYTLPRPNVLPTNLGIDSNGQIWVTEQIANSLASLNPVTGAWREFAIPTLNSLPSGITVDRADNVWFTEFQGNNIGLLQAGQTTIQEFAIPTFDCGPEDITEAPNGTICFTEQYGNKVGVLTVPGIAARAK